MARNATKGAPPGRASSGIYAGSNPARESEQFVLIVADNDDLRRFASEMHGYIDGGVQAQGGTYPVTADDFVRYCVTAVKVRVEHVTRTKWRNLGHAFTGLTVDEGWALPVPMHDVLSSIGKVSLGSGETTVYPVWDATADVLVLNKVERDRITRETRAACSTLGISVFAEMSKDVEGHHQTMVLVYLPNLQQWWSQQPFAREDASIAAVLGTQNVVNVVRGPNGAAFDVVDTVQLAAVLAQIPLWMPDLRIDRQVVVRYLPEMAKLAG